MGWTLNSQVPTKFEFNTNRQSSISYVIITTAKKTANAEPLTAITAPIHKPIIRSRGLTLHHKVAELRTARFEVDS